MSDMLTPLQAAVLLGVSTRTVTRWADDPAHPLTIVGYTAGGQRRFDRAAVEALAAGAVA